MNPQDMMFRVGDGVNAGTTVPQFRITNSNDIAGGQTIRVGDMPGLDEGPLADIKNLRKMI